MRETKRPKIVVNAMHTSTGGGLIYLRGVMAELVKDERFEWQVLALPEVVQKLGLPAGVRVHMVPKLDFWRGHVWEQLKLPLLLRGWGAKVVLCNANYVPLLAPSPVPIVHTTPRAAGQALTRGMKIYWWALRWLTTVSLWRAPAALSVAQHVIADYVGPLFAKKVRVAPPAVALPEMAEVERDPNLVVTVGDFYAQKDYPTLLRAFALLRKERPGTRLMLVGRAVDVMVRDEVLRLVRDMGIADGVTLTGAVPHEVLLKTLGKASVYISTSKAECFNMPVLEAMACGVPCVLGESAFQREVAGEAAVYVETDKGGYIPAAFAVAMLGILANPSIGMALRRKGLVRAKDFSWSATAATILNVLTKVTGVKA